MNEYLTPDMDCSYTDMIWILQFESYGYMLWCTDTKKWVKSRVVLYLILHFYV